MVAKFKIALLFASFFLMLGACYILSTQFSSAMNF